MQKIGVIGCGLMGFGMVVNLLKKGWKVTAFDADPEAVRRAAEEGAEPAASAAGLARSCDVLVLSLPSTDLVQSVLMDGREGVLRHLEQGSIVLDMSTNDVECTRNFEQAARAVGISYFDCPVSGGPAGARSGTLTIMVGGDEEAFSQVASVLGDMGSHVEYMGPSGSGQIVKLCNNMVVGGIISLLAEALLTGEKAGMPKERLAEIFQKGSGQTKVMDVFGPSIIKGTFDDVTFSLANMLKDLTLYRNLAGSEGVPTAVSDAAYDLFTRASAEGNDRRDSTAVAKVLANQLLH
ncbi:NAD(P)-dependent oxidoreductase [Sporosarcina koreensis]|uniref:NAD(P)-dependent oxidoreductase n=1 Tax=Sporosarcina koreensis TaxID=334735 RepID=UPI000590E836|nr:NAD(P)-dependent oxidoreductase [Sporosarcina koreensis]